jgi:hypothetical protein
MATHPTLASHAGTLSEDQRRPIAAMRRRTTTSAPRSGVYSTTVLVYALEGDSTKGWRIGGEWLGEE